MNFLIIVTVVLLVHHGEWMPVFQRDGWLAHWQQRFLSASALQQRLSLVYLALPVVLLAFALYALEDYRWLVYAINLAVLLYAIGRGSWRTECDSWVRVFAEKDPQVMKQYFAEPGATVGEIADSEVETLWLRARREVLYHQLEAFYTVVFWFFLLGAPMALWYRILRQISVLAENRERASNEAEAGSASANPEAALFLWLMEWLPVRIMGLVFCLVGNFTTGFWVLGQLVRDGVLSSADALARAADAALFLDGSVSDDEPGVSANDSRARTARMIERMESESLEQRTLAAIRRHTLELQALLHRSEWAFLVSLALIALL